MKYLNLFEKVQVVDLDQLSHHYEQLISCIEQAVSEYVNQSNYSNEIGNFMDILFTNGIVNGKFEYSTISDKQIIGFLRNYFYRMTDWEFLADLADSVEDICNALRTKYFIDVKSNKIKETAIRLKEEISNS